jgi:ABC-type transport system involved in cytochrome c biogenesis permease subunit
VRGALAIAVVFSIFAIFYAKGIIPPTPKKTTVWALLFFMSESTAHALFYTGALYAFFSIVEKNTINGFYSWIVWGFVAYTVAQVTGAIWCFIGWGNTFSWGSRHLSSAAIWTFYAACLHLKFIPGWRRSTALVSIAGAALVFFISFSNYIHEMRFLRVGG